VVEQRKAPMMGSKKESKVVCDYDYDLVYDDEQDPAVEQHKKVDIKVKVKSETVDEDLYKISPGLLHAPPRRVIL
jgi:hypothetical protein